MQYYRNNYNYKIDSENCGGCATPVETDWKKDKHMKAVVNEGFRGAQAHLKGKYRNEKARFQLKDVSDLQSQTVAGTNYVMSLDIEMKTTEKIDVKCTNVKVFEALPGKCKQTTNKYCVEFKPDGINCSDNGKGKNTKAKR